MMRGKRGIRLHHRSASSSLNPERFDGIMSSDFASGFEESEACFSDVCAKAAHALSARYCTVFLVDDREHRLYTFARDRDGNEVRATKPLDRGITASVISDPVGFNVHDVSTSRRWSPDLDELPDGRSDPTTSYLAWPLWDAGGNGPPIGVVEFRNKYASGSGGGGGTGGGGGGAFNAADSQLARIVASHLGQAVMYQRQQELLAGRDEAFNKAYEKSFDKHESITLEPEDSGPGLGSGQGRGGGPDGPPLSSLSSSSLVSVRGGEKNGSTRQGLGSVKNQRSAFLLPSPTAVLGLVNIPLRDRGWDYDVFLRSDHDLRSHAADAFDERGLLSRFSIPMTTFLNFMDDISAGYSDDAPYHNRYHAFDVMHVCYLLITRCGADEYLESFNTLSILVAALAHDLGHDGYNNAFHAATESDLAVTYNGVSILENYSAAFLFRILRKERSNILGRLNDAETIKMRSRLIDLILDTDAKNHFILMTRFKHGLESKQLSRGLLSSVILHVSDVSNPTRPGTIAKKWAFAVQEEFFRQGDKERELNLPRSPFMDREFENLPRMQAAFIDALVSPVFRLLADFLPLVRAHCVKPLLINRAFWNHMQNEDVTTTEGVKAFMASRQKEVPLCEVIEAAAATATNQADNGKEGDDITYEGDVSSSKEPIPGIPTNAPQAMEHANNLRKMSIISLHQSISALDSVDPELGERSYLDANGKISFRTNSPLGRRRSLRQTGTLCYVKARANLSAFLDSNFFQTLMLFATIYALFGNDLNLAVGNKESDAVVDIVTFVVLILFLLELLASVICVPKYMQFFFWLDLAATVSLVLEIDFLLEMSTASGSPDQLYLAKTSRAAKAGAKAGRLAKLLRLVRLIKIVKLFKWLLGLQKKQDTKRMEEDDYDADEDIDFKMSVVGRKMTESITKKVIIAVMLMLLVFSLMEVSFIPDARQIQLDGIGRNPESDLLIRNYLGAHDNIVGLRGIENEFVLQDRIVEMRDAAKMTLLAETNPSIGAIFDLSQEITVTAWYSMGMTLIVTSLLAVLSMMFSRDAYRIMIRPIEKMKSTVQQLSENPLLHLEKMKKRGGVNDTNETDILQQAITKMATLLQIGFGCAGAEIIAKSLSEGGELDPMVPGVRVHAIFGFCDIRDFTFATEGLQQDVMLFVNKIAEITHKHVVDSGGAPNKNIGDAFLLVWKLKSSKDGSRSNLQKYLFDAALGSFLKIISDIKKMDNLAAFLQEETASDAAWRSTLDHFKVEMGFGLHTGWAIEGSIGSKVKIDASYLSPHVNLASRLEAATKQYHVPLLMSEQFVSGLTGSVLSMCRRVDSVTFKGSSEPMKIYLYDAEAFDDPSKEKPENYAELLAATSWKDEAELDRVGVDVRPVLRSLQSEKLRELREVYDRTFDAYIDGKWGRCKVLCHLWMERFPGDAAVHVLTEFLWKHDFHCPEDWRGYHALRDK